ncbi:hypothetical protein [Caulobacter sp. LARHSG274]
MKTRITMLAMAILVSTALSAPSQAAEEQTTARGRTAATQLEGVTRQAAEDLIGKLETAQKDLRQRNDLTFALLSGAPAFYKQARLSPRDAFLDISFARPFSLKKLPADNANWMPYRIEILPDGPGRIVCDVDVILGFNGQIERVQLYYRQPDPF